MSGRAPRTHSIDVRAEIELIHLYLCIEFSGASHSPSPLQNDSERTNGRYVTVNFLAACVKRLVKRIKTVFSIKSDLHTDS